MDQSTIVPRVAFVINLGPAESDGPQVARVHHLIHLFHGHRLPATWEVADAERVRLLQTKQISTDVDELALTVDAHWCGQQVSKTRFRNELIERLARLQTAGTAATTLVVSETPIPRNHVAILAEQGIRAILTGSVERCVTAKPRPLPRGVWQLAPNVLVPQKHRFPLWLPLHRTTARQLIAAGTAGGTTIVGVQSAQLGRSSARSLQQIEKLLREVAWAASRNQLVPVTVGQIVAELTIAHEVKPQRSILRLAA